MFINSGSRRYLIHTAHTPPTNLRRRPSFGWHALLWLSAHTLTLGPLTTAIKRSRRVCYVLYRPDIWPYYTNVHSGPARSQASNWVVVWQPAYKPRFSNELCGLGLRRTHTRAHTHTLRWCTDNKRTYMIDLSIARAQLSQWDGHAFEWNFI